MWLFNLYDIQNHKKINVRVDAGKITTLEEADHFSPITSPGSGIIFNDAIVFPGLINSHDHLDFNLFPQLANRIYGDYTEWGLDIHQNNKEIIDAVLKVPENLRVRWGLYKNLLNGITTVVNHGARLEVENELVGVFQDCYSLHSVKFEKNWKLKLNRPFAKKQAFAIHVGEGTNEASADEIAELLKWNLFKRDLIGIHAVALKKTQAKHFKAVVWCPDSNYFLLKQTADIGEVKSGTTILFGTDSTLSADWNFWKHLRTARNEKSLNDAELFNSLTTNPAEVWPLRGVGQIAPGFIADLVVARQKIKTDPVESFYSLDPEDILLVMHEGKVNLFDGGLKNQMKDLDMAEFSKITVNGQIKFVRGDLPGLIRSIQEYYPRMGFPISEA